MSAVSITHIAHIHCPDALRDLPAWLIWRYEPHDNPGGKPRKVPYYAAGGRRWGEHGRPEDRAQLVTFDAARAAAARRGFDGVGFAPMPDFQIVALDFDACITAGEIHPEVFALLGTSYCEFSPSGQGIRAFFRGQLGNLKAHGEPFGFETFSTKGFVTFTGAKLDVCEMLGNDNTIAPVDEAVRDLCQRRFRRELERQASEVTSGEPVGLTLEQIEQALDVLPGDLDYDRWVQVGMAVHHETRGSEEGFALWDRWSSRSAKYTTADYGRDRWRSFGKHDGNHVTARSLIRLANEHGAHILINGPASAAEFDAVAAETAAEATTPADGAPAPAPKAKRFQPVPAAEFSSRPAPRWIVKGVLPQAGLAVIYGESGSGKTFAVLDIVMAVARGVEWRGRRVRQGRVVYVAAEGSGGFRNRLVAYARAHDVDLVGVPLDVIADQPNLLEKADALDIARAIGRASIVVVDTFAQVTPGGNENAGEDMGKALAHCAGIHRATGALVVLVHHSGKDASKGARGWSGIRAAADAELEVSRAQDQRVLRTTKQKDGEDSAEWGFALETMTIGIDEDGDEITSCSVVPAEVPSAQQVRRKLGPVERVVNEVIQEMAQAQTEGIEVEAVVREAVGRLPEGEDGKRDTRRMRVRRALKTLCEGDSAPYWMDEGCLSVA